MAELPQIEAEALSVPVDLTRSAGAAERASAEAWSQVAARFGDITQTLAGVYKAVNDGELARQRNAIDAAIGEIGLAHDEDPEAFSKSLTDLRTSYIEAAPSRFARRVGEYIDAIGAREKLRIATARQAKDYRLSIEDQQARLKTVGARISDRLREGIGFDALSTDPTAAADVQEFDDGVQALVDARAIAPAAGELMKSEARGAWKTDTFAHEVAQTYREHGYDGALALLQELQRPAAAVVEEAGPVSHEQPDQAQGLAGYLTPAERDLAYAKGSEILEREHGLATRRQAAVENKLAAETRAIKSQIEDDIGSVELSGRGNGLTQEAIFEAGGNSGDVADWLDKRSQAWKAYREHGELAQLSPDAASARIATSQRRSGVELPAAIRNEGDLDGLLGAMSLVETAGRPEQVSSDGAIGEMQLLPATAARMARKLGVAYDGRRLLKDPAYNRSLAKAYLGELLDRYQGDAFLAVTAYHAGEGNVDRWIKRFGDPRAVGREPWLSAVGEAGNPRSAAYPTKVAAAMKGGEAWASWNNMRSDAWANARAGFASDPINFARERGFVSLEPLPDFRAPGFGQALKARLDAGGTIAARYAVPKRMLTGAEAKALADIVDSNPATGIMVAEKALNSLGPAGAADLLREIGQTGQGEASTQLHIADIAAGGSPNFALTAAQGLQLKAEGNKLDPDVVKDLDEALADARPALGAAGAVAAAARNTAEAAMIADRARGVEKSASYYVTSALGGTSRNGVRFGGPAEVNGARTIVPRWLAADHTRDALEALAGSWERRGRGPVYANGSPVPAREVAKMRLQLMPDGRYRLVTRDGRALMHRSGSAFAADFDGGRSFLAKALGPGAVLGGR